MTNWQGYVDFMKSKGNISDLMIVSSEDAATWASTPDFQLREYNATIAQEDGSEAEELVNEATNLLKFMKGEKPPQGLRLNGGKKQQILRLFKDDGGTDAYIVYGKITKGGCCVASAGKCILIGTFDEMANHTSVGCNEIISLMAKYLVKSSWPVDESQLGGNASTWKPYMDNMLLGKGNIAHALICSKEDGIVWSTSSEAFKLAIYEADIPQEDGTDKKETIDEMKNVVMLMKGGAKPPQGLRIQEKKYTILRNFMDDDAGAYTVYGKKTQGGCCVMVTNIAIILAVFEEKEGHTSSGCNTVVSDLVKFLKSKNM